MFSIQEKTFIFTTESRLKKGLITTDLINEQQSTKVLTLWD